MKIGDDLAYSDQGTRHFDRHHQSKLVNRLIRPTTDLCFQAETRPAV